MLVYGKNASDFTGSINDEWWISYRKQVVSCGHCSADLPLSLVSITSVGLQMLISSWTIRFSGKCKLNIELHFFSPTHSNIERVSPHLTGTGSCNPKAPTLADQKRHSVGICNGAVPNRLWGTSCGDSLILNFVSMRCNGMHTQN